MPLPKLGLLDTKSATFFQHNIVSCWIANTEDNPRSPIYEQIHCKIHPTLAHDHEHPKELDVIRKLETSTAQMAQLISTTLSNNSGQQRADSPINHHVQDEEETRLSGSLK